MNGGGRTGIVHGYKSKFLLDEDGQVLPTHSVSAGLDYPGIGPELAFWGEQGRIEFVRIEDTQALDALAYCARKEGIIFALESAHAAAAALPVIQETDPDKAVIIHMSGRGEKDLFIAAGEMQQEAWAAFLREEADRYAQG
jgi:tryptophan synthase beta chain